MRTQPKLPDVFERSSSIDAIRALAIFLVILTHVIFLPKYPSDIDLASASFYAFLGQLSVPLFVIASGYLLLHKNESYRTFFVKRTRRVLVPWAFWTVIYVFWNMYFQQIPINSPWDFLRHVYRTFFSYFWFLPMIFGLYLLTPFLRVFMRGARLHDIFFVIVLWFAAVSFIPTLAGMLGFSTEPINSYVFQFSGFYLLGGLFRRVQISKQHLLVLLMVFLGIGSSSIVLSTSQDMSLFRLLYGHTAPFIVTASVGLFLLILHAKTFITSKPATRVIQATSSLSAISLGIYLIHPIVMDTMNSSLKIREVLPYSPLTIPYCAFVVFGLSAFFIFLLKRMPILKLFVA